MGNKGIRKYGIKIGELETGENNIHSTSIKGINNVGHKILTHNSQISKVGFKLLFIKES